jgi:cobalamin biosynthesis protein CobD/CbiB
MQMSLASRTNRLSHGRTCSHIRTRTVRSLSSKWRLRIRAKALRCRMLNTNTTRTSSIRNTYGSSIGFRSSEISRSRNSTWTLISKCLSKRLIKVSPQGRANRLKDSRLLVRMIVKPRMKSKMNAKKNMKRNSK